MDKIYPPVRGYMGLSPVEYIACQTWLSLGLSGSAQTVKQSRCHGPNFEPCRSLKTPIAT